jgi:hypothetical protein
VDGIDWLGGGDTIVRDCFIRAADDIFALYGNFVGYGDQNMQTPGLDVTNITVEKCVLSTSISNVVRTSFPKKVFNSANFVMRDSDIIHGGTGGCGVPFALFEIWGDQGASGRHVSYLFENIWLEYWYSLLHLRQSNPAIRDITFRNIWALTPSMVPSVISGDVAQVRLENINLAGTLVNSDRELPLEIDSGAQAPEYVSSQNKPRASFTVAPGAIRPGKPVTLDAAHSSSKANMTSYQWLFGDGTQATGKRVRHIFPDGDGTLRDGSGQFRVLLKVTDAEGHIDWAYQPVMVSPSLLPGVRPASVSPGLNYRYYEGTFTSQTDFGSLKPVASGSASGLNRSLPRRANDFGMVYEGYLSVPVDGAYLFLLTSRDGGRLEIDSQTVGTSPAPFPQRCGTVGNSVQGTWSVRALKAGMHAIRVTGTHGKGSDAFGLKWQGPGFSLKDIPDSAFFRVPVPKV